MIFARANFVKVCRARQQKGIDALKAELKKQKALIQKVSAQIESSKAAPQVVKNP